MGILGGLFKSLIRVFIYLLIIAAFIAFLPNLPPYTSFTQINLEPTLPRIGPLAPNNDLNSVQKLYTGKLLGPECFQLHRGDMYTSLATGQIVKLSPGGHVTFVTQIGKPCSGIKEEQICGRPLGFVIDEKKNLLYVADAYYGIWSVNLDTNQKTQLVSPNVKIGGNRPRLFNSVALDSEGNLYYTDSTSDYPLSDGAFAMLTDPSGRLIQYNIYKKENKVLVDNLWFSNGVVVSPDDEFVIVAETAAMRLTKYYLSGPKQGQKEIFIGGLPGYPDNLRVLPDGSGLQVALYAAFGDDEPILARSLASTPLVRKFLMRVQVLVQNLFQFLNNQFPQPLFQDTIYNIGHFRTTLGFLPNGCGLLHIDWNGNIKNAYFHNEGTIHISDGIFYNGKVYLGQPHGQDFVAAVAAPPAFKRAYTPRVQEKAKAEAPPPHAAPKPAPKAEPTKPAPVNVEKPVQKPEAPKTTPPPAKPTPTPPKPTPTPPKQAPTTTPPPATTTTARPVEKTTTPTPPPAKATPPPPPPAKTAPPSPPTKTAPPPPPAKTAPPPPPAKTASPPPSAKPAPAAKPQENATPPPPAKPAPEAKPKEQKPKAKATPPPPPQPDARNPKAPEHIPIKEEIPSDTIKPTKETLKVIKKAGPVEMPNPEL